MNARKRFDSPKYGMMGAFGTSLMHCCLCPKKEVTQVADQFQSQALEANLQQTDGDIELSPRDRWFLDLSSDYWGIHKRALDFLEEYNHNFVNYGYILECLHDISLNDLWFYNGIEESKEAFLFLVEIFADLSEKDLPEKERELLMKTLFKFLDRMLKEGQPGETVLLPLVNLIEEGMKGSREIYLRNAGLFKTYLPRLAALPAFREKTTHLTREILRESVRYWRVTTDA